MRRSGVSFARGRLLGVLAVRSPRTMSELGFELAVTRHNVTALVDGLEREGLVRRRAHPTDRRVTLVAPTTQGQELCGGLLPEGITAVAELFEVLPPADQRKLLRLIQRLCEEVNARNADDNN